VPWALDKVWHALAASRQDATGGDVDLCRKDHRDRRVTRAGVADGSTAVLGLECVVRGLGLIMRSDMSEVTVVGQVLGVLNQLAPAWQERQADNEREELAEQLRHSGDVF